MTLVEMEYLVAANLMTTLYLVLEVAEVKRAIKQSSDVDYEKPAVLELIHSWRPA